MPNTTTTDRIEAIKQLTGAATTIVDGATGDITALDTSGVTIPHPPEADIESIITKVSTDIRKKELSESVVELITNLTVRAEIMLSGGFVDAKQAERYRIKKDMVLANNVDSFQEEANLLGIDPLSLFNEVKTVSEYWENSYNAMIMKLEAGRRYLNSLLELGEFDKVAYFIKVIPDTTMGPTTPLLEYFNELSIGYDRYMEVLTTPEPVVEEPVVQVFEEPIDEGFPEDYIPPEFIVT